MLALVDVATNLVLDCELDRSENAPSTVRLIKRVCQTYGIFDRLYTDNGSAFAGHLVAGGALHRFRNSGRKVEGVKPLGICHHPGIDLRFALPTNAQAKIAKRAFASLSRVLDDRPESKGAHAGHAPGASPSDKVTPVPFDLAMAVIRREVAGHNSERGRRAQGMAGRSYQEVLEAGLALRIRRQPIARQRYLAGLIYKPVSVDRWCRVKVHGWTYGDSVQALIEKREAEQAALQATDPLQKALLGYRRELATATDAQRARIEELVAAGLREKSVLEGIGFVAQSTGDALMGGKDAGEQLIQTLIKAGLQAALLGQGPLAGLFGGGIPGFAAGGSVGRGSAPGALGQAVTVDVRVKVDNDDNLQAFVDRVSHDRALEVTQEGLAQYDRMREASNDPRGRRA